MKYIGISLITLLLLAGCASNQTQVLMQKKAQKLKNVPPPRATPKLPPKPNKDIKLQEVEDTNYSSAYMYPEGTNKKKEIEKPKPTPLATNSSMNKEECIDMISQEKFDKYTSMFGSEAASIKRCNMIKAMNH